MKLKITLLLFLTFYLFNHSSFTQVKKIYLDGNDRTSQFYLRLKAYTARDIRMLSDGLEDGNYELYSDESLTQLILKGTISNGKKNKLWLVYHDNGKVRMQIPYVDGQINGKIIKFNYIGDTSGIALYKDSKAHGRTLLWNDVSSEYYLSLGSVSRFLEYDCTYSNDTLIHSTLYYPSGEIRQLCQKSGDTVIESNYSKRQFLRYNYYRWGNNGNKKVSFENQNVESIVELKITLSEWSIISAKQYIDTLLKCTNLEKLTVEGTPFTGSDVLLNQLLQNASTLPYLTSLTLRTSDDPQSSTLSAMKNLTFLDIQCNKKISSGIFKLTQLEELVLRGNSRDKNQIYFSLSESVRDLSKLKSLTMCAMKFTSPETEFAKLSQNKTLYALKLQDCGLTKFPASVGSLTSIRFLDMGGYYGSNHSNQNTFTSLPDTVFKMKNLRYFMLPQNFAYPEINAKLKGYRKGLPLCCFDVYANCFPKNTLITLADKSQKYIQDIQVGDRLLCFTEDSKTLDTTTVTETGYHHPEVKRMLTIHFMEIPETITLTSEHPVYETVHGWTNAGNLKTGDQIIYTDFVSSQKKIATILSISDFIEKDVMLYNLGTTKKSYFAERFWVHNK